MRPGKIMFTQPARNGTRMPWEPPVMPSKKFASTKATSLNIMVAIAKNGPRRRNAGQEISTAVAHSATQPAAATARARCRHAAPCSR